MTKCNCYPWPDKCPYCGGQPDDLPEQGWQIVPTEPTAEMLQAATWALDRWRERHGNVQGFVPPSEKYQIRWRAMLAAAPSPTISDSLLSEWYTAHLKRQTAHADHPAPAAQGE